METLSTYEWPVRQSNKGSKYDVILNDVIYRIKRGDDLFPADDLSLTPKKIRDRFNAVASKRQCSIKCSIESADSLVIQLTPKTTETTEVV
jgi:hypothetical protein